tara:strand:+ start:188 stop:886 length:699 start_codon:yes stop_codon:yes gene_type:complete
MSKIYNFFPLSIYRDKIELPENTKKEMIEEIITMKKTSDKGLKPPQNAWTGDTHGYEYLFKNNKFKFFYEEVEKHVIKYMDHFEIDVSKLDFYFQRSWATLSNSKEYISPHDHSQSNLSFAYYLKKQPGDSQLILVDTSKHNEFIPQLFTSPSINRNKIFKKRTLVNTPRINIETEEDDIIIFPSKTLHGTEKNLNNKDRISISADISIIAKQSKNLEHLTPPISEWKKFNK